MIAYIEGRLLESTESSCILLTERGVGYEIGIPAHVLAALPQKGGMVALYTSFVVREDAQELFGFATWEERRMFLLLTSINRVGARTALSILSTFHPEDLRRLVAEEDVLGLTRVSGIGKKIAQQIFLELQYKLKAEGHLVPSSSAPIQPTVLQDALTGLTNLGYDEDKARGVLKDVLQAEPDLDVGSALRAALKKMGTRA